MTRYYFDHAASAPRRGEVLEAMLPWLRGEVGNPSGTHRAAREARRAIEDARDVVGQFVGADPRGVIFTGGGTESCQLALEGVVLGRLADHCPAHMVVSSIEHHAVLDAAHKVARFHPAAVVHEVPVTTTGEVDLDQLSSLLTADVAIVSVMSANNETGVLQPLEDVARLARTVEGVVTHTDAIAAAPFVDLARYTSDIDMVTLCAHKLGGPVNSGALILRRDVVIEALTPGGGQEQGHRGGTVDVAAAVGLAAACASVARDRDKAVAHVTALRHELEERLQQIPGAAITARDALRLPGSVHVTFAGLASDEMLFLLDQEGVCVSAGASCSSGAVVGSHVLAAMGVTPERARGALRLTIGHETTAHDVEAVAAIVSQVAERLRSETPSRLAN